MYNFFFCFKSHKYTEAVVIVDGRLRKYQDYIKMNAAVTDILSSAAGQISKVLRESGTVNGSDSLQHCEDHPQSPKLCDMKLIDAELGLSEEHFSCSEEHFGFCTIEELEIAIENCKEMILESEENSAKRKKLVVKLVQLRLKLQDIKDADVPSAEVRAVMGHHFEAHNYERAQQYCEKCCGSIWGVLYGFYCCKDCGYKCHYKCLNTITRTCAYRKVLEKPEYILDICPEQGLSAQNYRCVECQTRIFPQQGQPRRCEYTGRYYCSSCHWNSNSIIPARVVHNWDFSPRKVCRASLQFLRLMVKKPILDLEQLNPMLFSFVDDLKRVKKLRSDILVMKLYLTSCHAAQDSKLLLLLHKRQHFVENCHMYSLQDLVDLHDGSLLTYITQVHHVFFKHITIECQGCRGKGFLCTLCKSDQVLFPMEEDTVACPGCSTIYHKTCREQKKDPCHRCQRRSQQLQAKP
ncbi:differentially expressed in FDCP 8-like isoform X2 [Ornithodoros turicata]